MGEGLVPSRHSQELWAMQMRAETAERERDEARQRAERLEAEISELFVMADGMLEFTGAEIWMAEPKEYPAIALALADDQPAEAGGPDPIAQAMQDRIAEIKRAGEAGGEG